MPSVRAALSYGYPTVIYRLSYGLCCRFVGGKVRQFCFIVTFRFCYGYVAGRLKISSEVVKSGREKRITYRKPFEQTQRTSSFPDIFCRWAEMYRYQSGRFILQCYCATLCACLCLIFLYRSARKHHRTSDSLMAYYKSPNQRLNNEDTESDILSGRKPSLQLIIALVKEKATC